jgi:hypothetical protein
MILLGRTLFELPWQNHAARNRTAPQSKTSGPRTAQTKKGRVETPFQKVTVALTLSIAARSLMSVASSEARGYMKSLALMGRYRSGQTGQTVNLLALRLHWFESSPAHIPPLLGNSERSRGIRWRNFKAYSAGSLDSAALRSG